MIGYHPKNPYIGYDYGNLDLKAKEKKIKEQFTSNVDEMIHNPEKKMLLLGVHPELNTN